MACFQIAVDGKREVRKASEGPTGKSIEFLLRWAFELPKSRARKAQFRVAVQADLGGPVLRAKIIRFPCGLAQERRTSTQGRPDIVGRGPIEADDPTVWTGRALQAKSAEWQ